jgi:hypothetical protein
MWAIIRACRSVASPSRSSSARCWRPLSAQRAECTPGSPPKASTSIPESSPTTQASAGATVRPYNALIRAVA